MVCRVKSRNDEGPYCRRGGNPRRATVRHAVGAGSRLNVFYGYLFAVALMIAAALIAVIYGIAAARKSLEHVARPLSVGD